MYICVCVLTAIHLLTCNAIILYKQDENPECNYKMQRACTVNSH